MKISNRRSQFYSQSPGRKLYSAPTRSFFQVRSRPHISQPAFENARLSDVSSLFSLKKPRNSTYSGKFHFQPVPRTKEFLHTLPHLPFLPESIQTARFSRLKNVDSHPSTHGSEHSIPPLYLACTANRKKSRRRHSRQLVSPETLPLDNRHSLLCLLCHSFAKLYLRSPCCSEL